MAYEARIAEIQERIDSYMAIEVAELDENMIRPDEKKALTDALAQYSVPRTLLLECLPAVLDEDQVRAGWQAVVTEGRAAFHAIWDNALRDVDTPTTTALAISAKVAIEEDQFYELLDAPMVGIASDEFIKYLSELETGKQVLEEIWAKTDEEAQQIMRDEKTVSEEIIKVLEEAVEKVADQQKKWSERALEIAKSEAAVTLVLAAGSAITNTDLSDAADLLTSYISPAAEWLEAYRGEMEIREKRYKDYFENNHSSLLVEFRGNRERAKQFKDEHEYKSLEVFVETARKNISDLVSNGTPGQSRDCADLSSILLNKLEKNCQVTKNEWDEFVRANETRFFGPVGPDLDASLISSGRWLEFRSAIVANNLQELLDQWIGDSRKLVYTIEHSDAREAWEPDVRNLAISSLNKFVETAEEIARSKGPKAVAEHYQKSYDMTLEKFTALG